MLMSVGAELEPATGFTGRYRADDYNSGTGTWSDSSGNGHNLVLGGGTAPGKTTSDANFNGKPTVTFNGTTQWIESAIALSSLIATTAHTIYGVIRPTASAGTGAPSGSGSPVGYTHVLGDSDNTAAGGYLALVIGGSAGRYLCQDVYSSGNKWANTATGLTLSTVYGFRLVHASGTLYTRASGITEASVAAGTMGSVADFLQIGRDYQQNAGSAYTGEMAELIFYNTNLSAGDKTATEAYIAQRYGITW